MLTYRITKIMSKFFSIIILLFGFKISDTAAYSQQLHKHFELNEAKAIEKIDLKVSTKAGKSFVNAVNSNKPVEILGASENDVAASTFKIDSYNQTQKIEANLTCKSHMGVNLTEAVANSFFNNKTYNNDLWQLNLSEHIPFNLNLSYMVGDASIDLSRLAIERLKISSGSADVNLHYSDNSMNTVAMDTFFVKVNFGSINVSQLSHTMAKEIITEVSFGSIRIDCGDDWKIKSRINAFVGAGNMHIILPPSSTPVIIRLKDSPLCNIKMAADFEKIGYNAYGNAAYQLNPDAGLEFLLDVGMGSIVFKNP